MDLDALHKAYRLRCLISAKINFPLKSIPSLDRKQTTYQRQEQCIISSKVTALRVTLCAPSVIIILVSILALVYIHDPPYLWQRTFYQVSK